MPRISVQMNTLGKIVSNAIHKKYLRMFNGSFGAILLIGTFLVFVGFDVSGFFLYEILNLMYGIVFTGLDAYQEMKQFEQNLTGLFLFLYLWLPASVYIGLRMVWERSKFEYTETQIQKITGWKVRISCLLLFGLFYWAFGENHGQPNLCSSNCSNLTELFYVLIFVGVWIALYLTILAFVSSVTLKFLISRSN